MFNKTYKNLNIIEISKSALLNNFQFFQKLNPNSKVCPVLKSNAYGHGLTLVGKFISNEIKPEFICVDSLYEAYELKKSGVKGKILILGYTFPQNYKFEKSNFRFPLYDIETLNYLNKYNPGIRVHLKIDTGMNRLGIKPADFEMFSEELKKNNQVIVEGIYSHLADAENSKNNYSIKQINLFKEAIKYFENQGFNFLYKHINNTGGFINFTGGEFNLSRVGLGIYGIFPIKTNQGNKLKPVLKFKSHIVGIKKVGKDESIGYGRDYNTDKKIKIAVIPVGYFEGLDRRFSSKGIITVDNQNCRIVGNVCMNLTMINVSEIKSPYLGQEVIIFDNINDSLNSIFNSAALINTIPYEILVKINDTIKRVLV